MRKQCRRKVYALVNPISMAIEGACVSQGSQLDQLRLRELAALESFRTGKATVQDWSDLTAMMNLCENMAKAGLGAEALPTLEEAHTHLIEAAKRHKATKRMGMTFTGLQCLRDVYEYHDLQRQSVPRSVYEKHIAETANRIRSKSPEVTDVLEAA
jgi:hypothetical protein